MGKAIIPLAIIGGGIGLAAATGGLSLGAIGAAGGASAGAGGIAPLVGGAGLQGAMLAGGEVAAGVGSGGIFSSFMAALPSASTFKSIFAVGSGVAQMASGFAGNAAAREQAKYTEYQSRQELLRGLSEENTIREQSMKLQASNTARVAASGISLGGGVERQVNDALALEADQQLAISRANTQGRQGAFAIQSSVLRRRGSAGLLSGLVTGAATAGSAFV